MENLRIELSKNLKPKPQDETKLGFGNIFTDHMFLMDYDEGQGWHDARIVPYGPLPLDPAADGDGFPNVFRAQSATVVGALKTSHGIHSCSLLLFVVISSL